MDFIVIYKIIQTKQRDCNLKLAYIEHNMDTEWKPLFLVLSNLNVKLSLHLISHHAMKAYEGLEMWLHSLFTRHY
jgi:hypothetical protein